jgi:hypothetical protein
VLGRIIRELAHFQDDVLAAVAMHEMEYLHDYATYHYTSSLKKAAASAMKAYERGQLTIEKQQHFISLTLAYSQTLTLIIDTTGHDLIALLNEASRLALPNPQRRQLP